MKNVVELYLKNPIRLFAHYASKGHFSHVDDELYLKLMFKGTIGKRLNLKNPVTFSEKLQWLKLHDHDPRYPIMADKFRVRDYIAREIGEEYLIPLIGVFDSVDDIDFDLLPNQFVLKCNHNSGLGMCICKDKRSLDIDKARENLRIGLAEDYYSKGREWAYKDIPRKIVCEKFMVDESGCDLPDYKIHCFNGEPRLILVCQDRFTGNELTEDFFSEKWEHLPIKRQNHPWSSTIIKKPSSLEEMLAISRTLSKDIPFVRTDFYLINGKVYFGELTFFPASGFAPFIPEAYDKIIGEWLILPVKNLREQE